MTMKAVLRIILFAVIFAVCGLAQPQTVAIVDTLYRIDGTLWTGEALFSASSSKCRLLRNGIPYGLSSKRICIGTTGSVCNEQVAAGVINVSLVPTVGSEPPGCAYSVRFFPEGHTTPEYTETWTVGSTGPLIMKDVRLLESPSPAFLQPFVYTFTNQTSVTIPASLHGFTANVIARYRDTLGNFQSAAIAAPGGNVVASFSEPVSGSIIITGGTASGHVTVNLTASPQTIPQSVHNLAQMVTAHACYDASGNEFTCLLNTGSWPNVTVSMVPFTPSTLVLHGR